MKIALVRQAAGDDRQDNVARGVRALEEAARRGAALVAYADLASLVEKILYADVDLAQVEQSHARQLFLCDRCPELYGGWLDAGRAMTGER